jgi:hypothetical protein
MKSKLIKIITTVSYYPRLFLDKALFLFVKNDYSLLDVLNNENCLIVGNGPSLKKTDLDKIEMPSIGMNKINLLFDKTTWRPNIIVSVNGLVIKQNKDFFNSTNIPLVLPIKAMYLGIKKRPNVIFVKISNSMKFTENLDKPLGIGSTVTYTCFQIAAFAKVKSVSIVGVDHSFNLNSKSKNKEHNIEILEGEDNNHFDPNYFKDKLWGLPDLDGSEKAYLLAKHYFISKKIPIKDYTINGQLQVFEKGNILDIYN